MDCGVLVVWISGCGFAIVMLFSDVDMSFLWCPLTPSSFSRCGAFISIFTLSKSSSSSFVVSLRASPSPGNTVSHSTILSDRHNPALSNLLK